MDDLRKMIAGFLRGIGLAAGYALAIIGSCLAMPVRPVRKVINGLDPNMASLGYGVYATYDRYGLIADYVVAQVAALAHQGYRVIFVSTSPCLLEREIAKIVPYSWKILHRRNLGHDFGSYKEGIRQVGSTEKAESLILMNDSCYGPLFNLAAIEQQAQASCADVWGITDSWWKSYHVQSYFLRLNRRALSSPAFHRFWATLLPYQPREIVIRNGEIRFTQRLVRSGLITGVLCPYQAVAEKALKLILARIGGDGTGLLPADKRYLESLADQISKGVRLNQMHSFWDVLIVDFACPFIKRGLLQSNPARIRGLVDWPSLLSQYTDYDIALIERHMKIG
jgi:lipopolysaccharide biosynthesis protein